MTNSVPSPTAVANTAVAMFTIADQDAAITQALGWELRAGVAFGGEGGNAGSRSRRSGRSLVSR